MLEESVRFELTEHYCSSVFKTDAINQTLPTFHVALGIGLEPITLWLTARCSTIELPKNKWRMVQDLNLWLFFNNISLAKKLNNPLWQPSMWVCVKTGYLRSHSNGDTLTPTTVVATHRGFTLWRMLGSNQHLLFSRLWPSNFWSRTSMFNLTVLYL